MVIIISLLPTFLFLSLQLVLEVDDLLAMHLLQITLGRLDIGVLGGAQGSQLIGVFLLHLGQLHLKGLLQAGHLILVLLVRLLELLGGLLELGLEGLEALVEVAVQFGLQGGVGGFHFLLVGHFQFSSYLT